MQAKVTIDMIETKDFKHERDGYSQMEVDTFLDDICDEMERQLSEINSLRQQLNEAKSAAAAQPVVKEVAAAAPVAAPAAQDGDAFREILEMAQKVKSETIADAQKKAEQIVADAEEQVRARLGNLMDEKESLTKQVDALKATVANYRTQFTALLQTQQEALDQVADL